MLADRTNASALGDDGPDCLRLRACLEHELAAEREPEAADAIGVVVRSFLQIGDGGLQGDNLELPRRRREWRRPLPWALNSHACVLWPVGASTA